VSAVYKTKKVDTLSLSPPYITDMTKFILFFLTIYTLMHTLFFFRIRVLFPDGKLRSAKILFLLFLFVMILSPAVCRFLERAGHESSAKIAEFIAFYWMGFIFLGFAGSFLMGLYDGAVMGIKIISRFSPHYLSGKTPALIMLGIITTMFIYGIFEARSMKIEHLRFVTNKLPQKTDSLKIVLVSDIHVGISLSTEKLKKITERIQSLSPDILVCTGDLVDSSLDHLPELADLFQPIKPIHGKYAVTGNHEYYVGISRSLEFMNRAGFKVLRGEAVSVSAPEHENEKLINIVGVDDHEMPGSSYEVALLSSVQNGLFTLFLRHKPVVSEKTLGMFDLQLSGHTHGGQIFPFHFVVSRAFSHFKGYYQMAKGSSLYVSRGTGTWGPQIRIFSPPEITLIELIRKTD